MPLRQPTVLEMYVCPDCGLDFPVWRPAHKRRKRGHLKKLWCVTCREEKNFSLNGAEKSFVDGNWRCDL
jgi:hypothetical protein